MSAEIVTTTGLLPDGVLLRGEVRAVLEDAISKTARLWSLYDRLMAAASHASQPHSPLPVSVGKIIAVNGTPPNHTYDIHWHIGPRIGETNLAVPGTSTTAMFGVDTLPASVGQFVVFFQGDNPGTGMGLLFEPFDLAQCPQNAPAGTSNGSGKALPSSPQQKQLQRLNEFRMAEDRWRAWVTARAASSGGTPGGSDTQIQFNNAGVIDGSAHLTYTASSKDFRFGDTSANASISTVQSSASLELEAEAGQVRIGDPKAIGNGTELIVSDDNQNVLSNRNVAIDTYDGLILKDNAGTPHYWRLQVSTLGVLSTTDLGTSIP